MTPDLCEDEQRDALITTITLDISNKHLKEVPKSIKNFTNIEFLYLTTNDIKSIPDTFFPNLPQLKWLDFRHNKLTSVPSNIGEHRQLRTLLLQGNRLTRLPIQLGNVPTLTGLNIADNPLDFPPKTVLQSGTQKILKFLRVQLNMECLLLSELVGTLDDLQMTENNGYLGSGEEDKQDSKICVTSIKKRKQKSTRSSDKLDSTTPSLYQRSATLQPRSTERRWSSSDNLITTKPRLPKPRKKFRSANPVERVKHSDHYVKKTMKDFEEKRMLAIQREENSRTEMIVQRMRDREALKEWRQENMSPHAQRSGSNHVRYKIKRLGVNEKQAGLKDPPSLEEKISFIETQIRTLKSRELKLRYQYDEGDVSIQLDKICTLIERKTTELMELQRNLIPRSQTVDTVRPLRQKSISCLTEKEQALKNRIREHAQKLREYSANTKSTSDAQYNLHQAQVMHDEVQRMNKEYRFKAFTGDIED